MHSQENKKTLSPRPMRKSPLLAFLAGVTTIVVVSGSMACRPLDILRGDTLGIPPGDDIEWSTSDTEDIAWAALYLASDESKMLSGTSIDVNGSQGIL